jgi:hypothetical protein
MPPSPFVLRLPCEGLLEVHDALLRQIRQHAWAGDDARLAALMDVYVRELWEFTHVLVAEGVNGRPLYVNGILVALLRPIPVFCQCPRCESLESQRQAVIDSIEQALWAAREA